MESRVESGRVDLHPIKRARTTFTYLAVATKGSDAQKAAFRAAVERGARAGVLDRREPGEYNAFDKDLQMWVAACLYKGAVDVYRIFIGEMDDETADRHYCEGRRWARRCRCPQEMWPADRAAFERVLAGVAGAGAHRRRRPRIPVPDRRRPDARGEAARAAAALVRGLRPADHDGLSAAAVSRRDAAAMGRPAAAAVRPADGRAAHRSTTCCRGSSGSSRST